MRPRVGLQTLIVLATFCAGQRPADAGPVVRCTGRVVEGEEHPVAGAEVVVFEMFSDGLAGNFTLQKAGELVTTEDGAFAVGALDDEGYFRVHLSEDQFRDTQAGKAELQVYMRYKRGRARDEAMAPTMGLLARDKEKAGVAKVPRPHADLTPLWGHALPPLDPIGHGVQRDQASNKAILVCFFDVDQRPSRNCLLQMGRRLDSLTAGGLVVLGVQASRVEQDTLTAWLTQNGLALPVGQIAMPEEITRAAWGVKSLPWLVLTDKGHTVTAESFAIDELDAGIEEAGSRK